MKKLFLIVLIVGPFIVGGCAQAPKKVGTVFYPALPEKPRIQYLTSISSEDDIGEKESSFMDFLVGKTEEIKKIGRPWGIAHEKGKLYLVDKTYKAVFILDLVEGSFDYIRMDRESALRNPAGIFIAKSGYKYIADADRGQIIVFDNNNEFYRTYGEKGQFKPLDVVVDNDRIYVCDIADHEIEVLDRKSGKVITKIGKHGQEKGMFHWPTHLAMDENRNLYVTDALNFRVQIFDREGRLVKTIGGLGDHPGAMPRPKGIAVDRQQHLYAVDVAFELVQIFDVEKALPLMSFGKFGPSPGGTYLPAGIHIDYDNVDVFAKYADKNFKISYLIYVGNQAGKQKINVYGFGDWTGGETAGGKDTKVEK